MMIIWNNKKHGNCKHSIRYKEACSNNIMIVFEDYNYNIEEAQQQKLMN